MTELDDPRTAFLEAATWHGSLERAEAILTAHPELASRDLHTAAVLDDDAAVRRFIEQDPANVTAKSPPYGGDALNYLGLSVARASRVLGMWGDHRFRGRASRRAGTTP